MTTECPSQARLVAFLDESSTVAEVSIDSHVARCEQCQKRLDLLTSSPLRAHRSDDSPSRREWTHAISNSISQNIAVAMAADTAGKPNRMLEEPGPEIAGYDILDRIGRGGSADVYSAFHRKLRRTVALKIIRAQARPDDLDRFHREAEALARIRHPGVVQIYETGQAQGRPYMALEYEPGGSLAKYLQGKPQDPVDAARFLITVALAIHEAHQVGMIHRDLKPGNILLHPDPTRDRFEGIARFTPKVTDFGLVKNISVESALTCSRDVLGTPSYMAPEQVEGTNQPITPATDVYAIGAVLYEMLAGRPPFQAANPIDTVVQVRFAEPLSPSRLTPSIPRDLETICLKCLSKEPAQRYDSAAALAEDLTRFTDGRPVLARPVRWPIRAARWMRRNPRLTAVSAVLISLLTALAIAGPIIAYRQSELRLNAEHAEAKALAQRDRADRNVQAAGSAMWQTLLIRLSEASRTGQPMPPEARRELVQFVFPYLEQAQSGDRDLPVYRERWGIALYLRGTSAAQTGDRNSAVTDLNNASESLDRLSADIPENVNARLYGAYCRLELARLAVHRNDVEANAAAREALERFEDNIRRHPEQSAGWVGLAEAATHLADLLDNSPEKLGEALSPATRAVEAYAALNRRFEPTLQSLDLEVQARARRAALLTKLKQTDAAVKEWKDAVVAAGRTPVDQPSSPNLILLRSATLRRQAVFLLERGQLDDALVNARKAEDLAQTLQSLFPNESMIRINLERCRETLERCRKPSSPGLGKEP